MNAFPSPRSRFDWRIPLLLLGATVGSATWAAGYVTLSKTGDDVLSACNPANDPAVRACLVDSLPGVAGFNLVDDRTEPIVINEIEVGTLSEKVWQSASENDVYIFGARIDLNNAVWDDSGQPFVVNDLFRHTRPGTQVSVAYSLDGAASAVQWAGRTVQGLGEYEGDEPKRRNKSVDLRIAVNGAGGVGQTQSPWLLVKTKARNGITLDPFGIRLLNSSASQITELYLPGYQPD